MRKLLWVGDAGVASGFARVTHETLDVLRRSWDVHVLGINYRGDPHKYPYPIYPAWLGGDLFGVKRLVTLVNDLQIDAVVLLNDVWNVPAYMQQLFQANLCVPVIGWLAVDGKNCQGTHLNGLAVAVFWTKFAEMEAQAGGYFGASRVVPLGVDLNIYRQFDQKQIRALLEPTSNAQATVLSDSFVVGNVNRNQPRKRLDLTVEYFCDWVESEGVKNAKLLLHVCPTGEAEYDVEQLMDYRGFRDHLIMIAPPVGQGVSEAQLAATYSLFDVQVSTSQGEGFGLTTFEGMACGIPQIVPDWSALGELCEDAALKIPCTSFAATTKGINAIGGIPDRVKFIEALNWLYHDKFKREELVKKGLALVNHPRYRWEHVALSFDDVLDEVMESDFVKTWQDLGRPEEASK